MKKYSIKYYDNVTIFQNEYLELFECATDEQNAVNQVIDYLLDCGYDEKNVNSLIFDVKELI